MSQFCLRCGGELQPRLVDHRERPACPACGWVLYLDPKVAVAAVLEVAGGIVLCRRAIEPGLGKWSFPAGFVDRGEEVKGALLREIREETGLEAQLGRLVGVYSTTGNPTVLIVYAATATGTLQASAEAFELAVFEPRQLPEMAFAHDEGILADWLGAGSSEPG